MAFGKLLIILGLILVGLGLIVNYAPWSVNWFGKLPGDINIHNKNSIVFIPVVSMLIVSVVLSLIINLFFRK